jgi:hypothetical protein
MMMMLRAGLVALTLLGLAALPLLPTVPFLDAAYAAGPGIGTAGAPLYDDKSNSPNPNDAPNDPITDRGGYPSGPGIVHVNDNDDGIDNWNDNDDGVDNDNDDNDNE